MNFENDNGSKWLIKSESEILGPFTYDQIVDLLQKKQISLIDEIRDPETRWLYVRENKVFKSVVEEIRTLLESHAEDTKTYQSVSKTVEDSLIKTKTNFEDLPDFDAPEQIVVEVANKTPSIKFEKPLQSVKSQSPGPTFKKYISEADVKTSMDLKENSQKIIILFVVFAVAVMGAVFGYNYLRKATSNKAETELVQKIRNYKFQGLNGRAAESFANLTTQTQKKILPELLEIYPALESTGAVDIAEIDTLRTDSVLTSDQKSNIELIYLQKDIKNNNLAEAQNRLIRATSLRPSSYLIKENEALLNLKNGQFKTAFEIFANILKQEINGRYLLGYGISVFGMPAQDRMQYGREVLTAIDKYTTLNYDFRKELLLIQLALAIELNDALLIKVTKPIFFNTPIKMSEQYVRPELLAFDIYNWNELSHIRSFVKNKLASNEDLIVFQLHDYLESNLMSEAFDFNKNNNEKLSDIGLRSQLDLLIFDAQNRIPEIKALYISKKLKTDSELNNFIIAKNKIDESWNEDISTELKYLDSHQSNFYRDWLKLMKLVKSKNSQELKSFLSNHFLSNNNFKPVLNAKSMVN